MDRDSMLPILLTRLTGLPIEPLVREHQDELLSRLQVRRPELVKVAERLSPQLLRSLIGTESRRTLGGLSPVPTRGLVECLEYFEARPNAMTIGVWDLETPVTDLAELLGHLNAIQRQLVFFRIKAAVPSGLVSRVERLKRLFQDDPGFAPDAEPPSDPNVLAGDFESLSDIIRTDIGVDFLMGITGFGVADNDADDGFEFDITTVSRGRCVLVSTYWLRLIAEEQGLSLPALTAWVMIAQILVDVSDDLEFHEDRRCMFDENEDDFLSLPRALLEGRIDDSCKRLIRPDLKEATNELTKVLAKHARSGRPAAAAR